MRFDPTGSTVERRGLTSITELARELPDLSYLYIPDPETFAGVELEVIGKGKTGEGRAAKSAQSLRVVLKPEMLIGVEERVFNFVPELRASQAQLYGFVSQPTGDTSSIQERRILVFEKGIPIDSKQYVNQRDRLALLGLGAVLSDGKPNEDASRSNIARSSKGDLICIDYESINMDSEPGIEVTIKQREEYIRELVENNYTDLELLPGSATLIANNPESERVELFPLPGSSISIDGGEYRGCRGFRSYYFDKEGKEHTIVSYSDLTKTPSVHIYDPDDASIHHAQPNEAVILKSVIDGKVRTMFFSYRDKHYYWKTGTKEVIPLSKGEIFKFEDHNTDNSRYTSTNTEPYVAIVSEDGQLIVTTEFKYLSNQRPRAEKTSLDDYSAIVLASGPGGETLCTKYDRFSGGMQYFVSYPDGDTKLLPDLSFFQGNGGEIYELDGENIRHHIPLRLEEYQLLRLTDLHKDEIIRAVQKLGIFRGIGNNLGYSILREDEEGNIRREVLGEERVFELPYGKKLVINGNTATLV